MDFSLMMDWIPFLIGIQIGPRIRVGGSLGKAGQALKVGAGKVAKTVAPVASFINPALGAALQVAGTAMDTSKGRVGFGDLARAGGTAALNMVGGKAIQLGSKVPILNAAGKAGGRIGSVLSKATPDIVKRGARAVGNKVIEGIASTVPQVEPDVEVGSPNGGAQPPIGARTPISGPPPGSTLRTGAAAEDGGGGGASWLDKLLMGATTGAGALDALEQRKLRQKAQHYAQGSYDARTPLRSRGMALLQDETPTDRSALFADPGNVYDTQRRAAGGS